MGCRCFSSWMVGPLGGSDGHHGTTTVDSKENSNSMMNNNNVCCAKLRLPRRRFVPRYSWASHQHQTISSIPSFMVLHPHIQRAMFQHKIASQPFQPPCHTHTQRKETGVGTWTFQTGALMSNTCLVALLASCSHPSPVRKADQGMGQAKGVLDCDAPLARQDALGEAVPAADVAPLLDIAFRSARDSSRYGRSVPHGHLVR